MDEARFDPVPFIDNDELRSQAPSQSVDPGDANNS
jgi:hypothetical protein